jgi:hypothetical protein
MTNPAQLDDEAAADAYDDAENARLGLSPCVRWVDGDQCPCNLDPGCVCVGHVHYPPPKLPPAPAAPPAACVE